MKKLIYILAALSANSVVQAEQYCPPEIHKTTQQFAQNNDGTVSDNITNLIWKRCIEGQSSTNCSAGTAINATWVEALQHVAAVNSDAIAGTQVYQHLGYSDWRLPNVKELASLVDLRCTLPAVDKTLFPNLPVSAHHWTSTPSANNNMAWSIEFTHGQTVPTNKAEQHYIHLVRTAP